MDTNFLAELYFGNSIKKWILCLVLLVSALLLNKLIANLASKVSYKVFKNVSQAKFYDEFSRLLNRPFINLINLLALYFSLSIISFPPEWEMAQVNEFGIRYLLHTLFVVALIWYIAALFLRATVFMEYAYHHLEDVSISKDLATFLKELTRVLIYITAFFAILAKAFEVNITALVTSLGIGGLAIALAAQDTLANLIGSFIIYLDKPFQVGELIELGEIKGTVEKIGFRTTRIRTLDRTLLIVPNKKIIDSNLNNIAQSSQRRVKFHIMLTYQSKAEGILGIIEDVKKAIHAQMPMTAEDCTVRFADFETSSLNLIVIYYVNSNDYDDMIVVKEKINIQIMEIVSKHGCQFAYPSQTIFMGK